MKAKFTFKKEKQLGNHWHQSGTIIKYQKKEVGIICNWTPYATYLAIEKRDINEDGNPNCKWRNQQLVHDKKSLAEVKAWLNENIDKILKLYNLHYI